MEKVVYTGPFDRRDLSEADLTRLGVDHPRDYSFNRDELQEVSNEMAKTLTEHGAFLSQFRVATEDEIKQEEREAAAAALATPAVSEPDVPDLGPADALAEAGGRVQGAVTPATGTGRRASTAGPA